MPRKQHLFVVTHWLLKALVVLCFVAMAMFGLGLGGVVVAAIDANHLGIPENLEGIPRVDALSIGALALIGILACTLLVLFALGETAAIVESAISGDPFVNRNARRLTLVGWLLLAFVAVQFLMHLTINRIAERLAAEHQLPADAMGTISFDSGVSPVALLAVLLIFVLAQIFRHGSEMRSELEGTV